MVTKRREQDKINDKNKKETHKDEVKDVELTSLISSRWSSFCVALTAINWPGAVWLERNFAFFSAVSAGRLVHFSVIIHSLFQLLLYLLCKKLVLTQYHLTCSPRL